MLVGYRKAKGHDITVVFDGWKTGAAQEQQSVSGGVKILYSRIGDKADAVIKRILSSRRREWIVVTSDRDIADYAWSMGSVPLPAETFLDAVASHMRLFPGNQEYDDEYHGHPRKGNPRQLSRREKAVRRVLQKL